MQKVYEETKKIIEIRREVRKYYGIEYAIVLYAINEKDNLEETDPALPNAKQWWCVEYTEKSRRLARFVSQDMLWKDTQSWNDKRMIDKYRQCEVWAVFDINWVLSEYARSRRIWVRNEIWYFVYVWVATFPKRVLFRIKKLIGTQA